MIDLTLPAAVAVFFGALYVGLYAIGLVIEHVRDRYDLGFNHYFITPQALRITRPVDSFVVLQDNLADLRKVGVSQHLRTNPRVLAHLLHLELG